jgi:hypothetical protein
MYGTGLAVIGWLLYAVARERRIAQLQRAVRHRLMRIDGERAAVEVAPVCAHRLLQGAACPLARDAWKRSHIMVDEVRKYQPRSKLLYDLRGGTA